MKKRRWKPLKKLVSPGHNVGRMTRAIRRGEVSPVEVINPAKYLNSCVSHTNAH